MFYPLLCSRFLTIPLVTVTQTKKTRLVYTSPEFQQKLLTLQPSIAEADITLQSQEPVMLLPRHCAVPEMAYTPSTRPVPEI